MDNEEFLRDIPKFLRRPPEPAPETPIFMTPRPAATPPPTQVPAAIQAPEPLSGRRPGALVPPPPPQPAPEEGAMAAAGGSAVVDLRTRRSAPRAAEAAPADFFAEVRTGIESLFASAAQALQDDGDDAAFQVTLPRSVIRQIRILAAREGTTQRAIVLKAMRLAGLTVPEGADIDRRILAGKRRQQA